MIFIELFQDKEPPRDISPFTLPNYLLNGQQTFETENWPFICIYLEF